MSMCPSAHRHGSTRSTTHHRQAMFFLFHRLKSLSSTPPCTLPEKLAMSGVISTDMVSSRWSTLCSLIPCQTFLRLSMTELLKDPAGSPSTHASRQRLRASGSNPTTRLVFLQKHTVSVGHLRRFLAFLVCE